MSKNSSNHNGYPSSAKIRRIFNEVQTRDDAQRLAGDYKIRPEIIAEQQKLRCEVVDSEAVSGLSSKNVKKVIGSFCAHYDEFAASKQASLAETERPIVRANIGNERAISFIHALQLVSEVTGEEYPAAYGYVEFTVTPNTIPEELYHENWQAIRAQTSS